MYDNIKSKIAVHSLLITRKSFKIDLCSIIKKIFENFDNKNTRLDWII